MNDRPYIERNKERKILLFQLAQEEYGLDLSYIREVLRLKEMRPLPRAPEFIEGVTSLRGHLIALINLNKRLNLREGGTPNRKAIVCQFERGLIGLIVDELGEIVSLPEDEIKPIPDIILRQRESGLISGIARIGGRFIPLLNLKKVLVPNEGQQFLGKPI